LDSKKRALVEALKANLGNVLKSCEVAGVSKSSYYNWMKEDPEFAEAVEEVDNVQFDFVQSKLFEQVEEGNTACIIFYLKTKGKKKGYSEKEDRDDNLNINIRFVDE
jgi:hypothetical protein